ncbi:hypothetical protein [Lactiplantibacillus paraplantarum]|nr:hypothetical protein [Lactiplantibacillus paraplantarum]WEE35595.1 hypothetical protein PWO93_12975 [Lactiplantibacillus paraplantarum]
MTKQNDFSDQYYQESRFALLTYQAHLFTVQSYCNKGRHNHHFLVKFTN